MKLPPEWKWSKLGDVFFTTSGGTPSRSKAEYYRGKIPWVKSGELDKGTIVNTEESISEEAIRNSSAKIFPKGTLLIALYGATIGKLAFLGIDAATNQAICGIYENEQTDSKFLYYYLSYKKQKLINQGIGGAQPNISQTILKNLDFPLAPKSSQKTIVSKIEELFSELDKGIENLLNALQQLKTYRQSVLKWAFEGRLTEEWRGQNSSKKGRDVLILIENKRAEKLKDLISTGKNEFNWVFTKLKKHTFKNKANIELPKEWCWSSILNACYLVVDCHNKTAPYQESGIYLIRTSNIKNGKLLLDNKMKYVSDKTYDYWSRRCPPEPGDILFTREAPMGEAAIIPSGLKVCMGQRLMLLRTFPEFLLSKYLHYTIMNSAFQQRMNNNAIGTGVKHLRVGDVEELIFPLCSTEEQTQIVEEIEKRLSIADKLEESCTQSLQQAAALRQSILKKAFEGKLVVE